MDQATWNALFIIIFLAAMTGAMVWWRYRPLVPPAAIPVPVPAGAGTAPAPTGAGATTAATTPAAIVSARTGRWSEVPIWTALLLALLFPVLWNFGYLPISTPVWFAIISILVLAALGIPNKKTRTVIRAVLAVLLVVLISIWFAPYIIGTTKSLDRKINHGDWSDPAGYVKTVVNGTVVMRENQPEHFYVVGEVKLVNDYPYTCLGISPEGAFHRVSSPDFRITRITAKSGLKEMAYVRVKPAHKCRPAQ